MGMIIPAAIGAGAQLGGAVLGGKAAKSAAKTQAQTTDKTLAFAREQEAAKKAAYDQSMKAYEAKWNAWQGQRQALLQRYGVDIAPPTMPGAGAAPGGATPSTGAPVQAPGIPGASRPAVADVGTSPGTSQGGLGAIAMSPAEQVQGSPAMAGAALPKWNDWAGMGLRA
jgi:hypothetical protein